MQGPVAALARAQDLAVQRPGQVAGDNGRPVRLDLQRTADIEAVGLRPRRRGEGDQPQQHQGGESEAHRTSTTVHSVLLSLTGTATGRRRALPSDGYDGYSDSLTVAAERDASVDG